MSETRKLAAILVADVVGYSRLAAADEERTLARLRALRSDLIDPTIALHHGRIVKRTGDGSIIEFRSVVDAMRCAVEVQRGMIERNAGLPDERRIEYRVGIHLGDIVEESDGDLMGDGVNIAARLQGICEPGGICLSEDAYRQVKGRLELQVADLGPKALKNITDPVHAYLLRQDASPGQKRSLAATKPLSALRSRSGIAGALAVVVLAAGVWHEGFVPRLLGVSGADDGHTAAPHLSIVVLPFKNLSGDPSHDRLVDGLTDNLTSELSRIRNSFVIARNTAFTFKDKNVDAKEIGKQLGVRYLLEGSIDRNQDRTRLNAQLIDAQSGAHLWADRFEENAADTFDLQDRFLARLGAALRGQLVIAEAAKAARATNPDAGDFAMRGRALMQAPGPAAKEQNDEAIALFEQALKLDPNEPYALAGLAWAYGRSTGWRWNPLQTDYHAKTLALADRAIRLNPNDVAAYIAKAYYMDVDWRLNEEIRVASAGLAIDPTSAALYAARGAAEGQLQRFDENISDFQKAKLLGRFDPDVLYFKGG